VKEARKSVKRMQQIIGELNPPPPCPLSLVTCHFSLSGLGWAGQCHAQMPPALALEPSQASKQASKHFVTGDAFIGRGGCALSVTCGMWKRCSVFRSPYRHMLALRRRR
jgi:hypothetical protein